MNELDFFRERRAGGGSNFQVEIAFIASFNYTEKVTGYIAF